MVLTRTAGRSLPPRPTKNSECGKESGKESLNAAQAQAPQRLTRSKAGAITVCADPELVRATGRREPGSVIGGISGGTAVKNAIESNAQGLVVKRRLITRSHSLSETAGLGLQQDSEAHACVAVESKPSDSDGEDWTLRQIEALQNACATIRPSPHFWRLVAEQVPGKAAGDCKTKFYSERSSTRSTKRLRVENSEYVPQLSTEPPKSNADAKVNPNGRSAVPETPKEAVEQNKATKTAGSPPAASARRTRASLSRNPDAIANPSVEGQNTRSRTKTAIDGEHIKTKLPPRGPKRLTRCTAKVQSPEQEKLEGCAFDLSDDRDGESSGWEGDKEQESGSDLENPAGKGVWTNTQETELRNAYAMVRPSVHFWLEISKQVSGKTAEECFNKFYSAHPTPPRPAARTSVTKIEPVQSPSSAVLNAKVTSVRPKQRTRQARREVRRILREQQEEDQDYEADAFAALERADVVRSVVETMDEQEATTKLSKVKQSTVKISANKEGKATIKYREAVQRLDISEKENLNPAIVSDKVPVASAYPIQGGVPEVLKKVTDPAKLDKYIDHLHDRHTSGRTASHGRGSKKTARSNVLRDLNSVHNYPFERASADVYKRAKQELRDLVSRSGKEEKNITAKPRMESIEEDLEDSEDSQTSFWR